MKNHSKYSDLDEAIKKGAHKHRNMLAFARELKEEHNREESAVAIMHHIRYVIQNTPEEELYPERFQVKSKSETKTESYEGAPIMPSAWDHSNDRFYTIDEYCERYGLRKDLVKSSKLVAHVGSHMVYNIVFKEEIHDIDDFDYRGALEEMLKGYEPKIIERYPGSNIGVITLTDLHFGAYVINLKKTQDFSVEILIDYLESAAAQVNRLGYELVHVHLLGDLIESFTGLNHPNVWQGMQHGMFGANVIKQFCMTFDKFFLQKVKNLGSIKIVAGNHDRATIKKEIDAQGWGADLISWSLELMGYDVEFSSSVITHTVDHISYILNHGHLGLTKMTTEEICWNYGVKGNFNFVMEGHLHSRIAKLNAKSVKNFKMVSDDRIDCRRQICAPFFTGNEYSEFLSFTTTPGFTITEANFSSGAVNVFDFSL